MNYMERYTFWREAGLPAIADEVEIGRVGAIETKRQTAISAPVKTGSNHPPLDAVPF